MSRLVDPFSRVLRAPARMLVVVSSATYVSSFSCSFPFDPGKWSVVAGADGGGELDAGGRPSPVGDTAIGGAGGASSGPPEEDSGAEGGIGGEAASSERTRRLLRVLAGENGDCAAVLTSDCHVPLAACAASEGCTEYAECVLDIANPTAETRCALELGTSLQHSWEYELLRHCRAPRFPACRLGENFECVNNYGPPGAADDIQLRQQVLLLGDEDKEVAFSATLCDKWTELTKCRGQPVAEGEADEKTGLLDVALPVGKNSGVGNEWDGYRFIQAEEISDSVLQTNVPFWGRRIEITRILTHDHISVLEFVHKADARRSVFVQVVDCLSDPAPGVSLELSNAPGAQVRYVDQRGNDTKGDATVVSSGAVGVTGYDPDQLQIIVAKRDGREVARWQGKLFSGVVHYLRLHPSGKQ